MTVKKSDIENLSKKEIESSSADKLYQYANKIVQCRMAESFNARIAGEVGIQPQYVAAILVGDRIGKRFRAEVERHLRTMLIEFVENTPTTANI